MVAILKMAVASLAFGNMGSKGQTSLFCVIGGGRGFPVVFAEGTEKGKRELRWGPTHLHLISLNLFPTHTHTPHLTHVWSMSRRQMVLAS